MCIITYCWVCDPLLLSTLSCFISFINKFVKCCNMDSTVKWNLRESLRLEWKCNSCQSRAECPKMLVAINTQMKVRHDLDWACGHTQQIYRELWIFFFAQICQSNSIFVKITKKKKKTTYMTWRSYIHIYINVNINTSINSASEKCVEGNKTHPITRVFPKSYLLCDNYKKGSRARGQKNSW